MVTGLRCLLLAFYLYLLGCKLCRHLLVIDAQLWMCGKKYMVDPHTAVYERLWIQESRHLEVSASGFLYVTLVIEEDT